MINCWQSENTNYGIILSGGGGKGSYQIGAIKALYESGFIQVGPRYIDGISVGAINAIGLAQYRRQDIRMSIDEVQKIWLEDIRRNSDIMSYRFPRYISGLFRSSVATPTKIENILHKRIDVSKLKESDVTLNVSAIDIKNGKIKSYSNKDENIIKAVMASSAYPFLFPPVEIDGNLFVDGGVKDICPIKRSVSFGLDNVICISTDGEKDGIVKTNPKNILDVGRDIVKICSADNFYNDVKKCISINQDITLGNEMHGKKKIGLMYLSPSESLGETFDFSKKKIEWRFELGYCDARKLIYENFNPYQEV